MDLNDNSVSEHRHVGCAVQGVADLVVILDQIAMAGRVEFAEFRCQLLRVGIDTEQVECRGEIRDVVDDVLIEDFARWCSN